MGIFHIFSFSVLDQSKKYGQGLGDGTGLWAGVIVAVLGFVKHLAAHAAWEWEWEHARSGFGLFFVFGQVCCCCYIRHVRYLIFHLYLFFFIFLTAPSSSSIYLASVPGICTLHPSHAA